MLNERIEMKLQTELGQIDIKNYAAGKQAQCIRINSWGESRVDAILKLAGENKAYTKEEAELLVEQTKLYRQELVDAGVTIPQNLALTTHFNGSEYQILMVDEFKGTGQDCKQAMSGDVVEAIVQFLHDLTGGQGKFMTSVLGDFKPDNFVWDGKLTFIDYFAPKRFAEDGLVTPYLAKIDSLSREGLTFICGNRLGQIARLLALISRDHKPFLEMAIETVNRIYADMPEVVEFVTNEFNHNFAGIDHIYQTKDWSLAV